MDIYGSYADLLDAQMGECLAGFDELVYDLTIMAIESHVFHATDGEGAFVPTHAQANRIRDSIIGLMQSIEDCI